MNKYTKKQLKFLEKSIKMDYFKDKTAQVINYLFQSLLVTYLILLLAEQIWFRSVSSYFNLNYLLIAVIIAGVLDVFSQHKKQKYQKPTWKSYTYVTLLGIAGFLIIKMRTDSLGWLSWLISVVAGILIILLSILVLDEDEKDED